MPKTYELTKTLRHFTIEVSVLTLVSIPPRITGEMLEDTILDNLNGVVVETVTMTREEVMIKEDKRQMELPL